MGCCGIEAIVTVDARGQLVLPKEVREQAGIKAGEKLAVVIMRREGEVCCISLMKADALSNAVSDMLVPAVQQTGGIA
jgi:AbrB family looped-hinge helix DNA binding protein